MSDGMSDSRREERAARRIEAAAFELVNALKNVQDEIVPWAENADAIVIVNADEASA